MSAEDHMGAHFEHMTSENMGEKGNEPLPSKQRVAGSSPAAPTTSDLETKHLEEPNRTPESVDHLPKQGRCAGSDTFPAHFQHTPTDADEAMRRVIQRLWDLVRYQRSELFQAELISDEEYAALAFDYASVDRLETYDGMRQKLAAKEAEIQKYLKSLRDGDAEIEALKSDRDEWKRRAEAAEAALIQHESEEASVCPDDVGVVEYVRTLKARLASAREALKQIAEYRYTPYEVPESEWAKHTSESCPECKRYRDMNHPIQHGCDGWHRLIWHRDAENERRMAAEGHEMRQIASAAREKGGAARG